MKTQADKMKMLIALITSTLYELPDKQAPSGHIYAAIMNQYDIHQYNAVLDTLIQCKFIERDSSHMITLLPACYEVAKQCADIFKSA